MGLFRHYFTKDNTIIKNNYTNTGLNPVLELVYGSPNKLISRSIFSFSLSEIRGEVTNKVMLNNVKHTLNLTNTVGYNNSNLNRLKTFGTDHASSFDLVLFKVPEFWDQGTGYDYDYSTTLIDLGGKVQSSPSNWYQKTGITNWTESGIYVDANSPQFQEVASIHFDLGNENIKFDITNIINDLTLTDDNFFGLGLAFRSELENLVTDDLYAVSFYGKHTNTFFEPFVETTWDDIVEDDRANFFYDKSNKLYLYTNINKEPIDLDVLPASVTIYDNEDNIDQIITNINHESKGVYSVQLEISSTQFNQNYLVNFRDKWSGLVINGRTVSNVIMDFTVRENNYFNIGNDVYEPQEFLFNFSGIKRGERIFQGEVRKLIIIAKEFSKNEPIVIDDIFYRMYVKQGNSVVEIIPQTKVNRAYNQNYVYLDTTWLITQDYFIEITVHSNGTVTKKGDIYFTVLDGVTDNLLT